MLVFSAKLAFFYLLSLDSAYFITCKLKKGACTIITP